MTAMNDFDGSPGDLLLEHAARPDHAGRLTSANASHTIRNPLCGDQATLDLQISPAGTIEQASCEARGCLLSRATASLLCEYVEGRTVEELRDFQATDMLSLLGMPLTPRRQRCGLLAFQALKTLLYAADDRPNASATADRRAAGC